MFRDIEQLKIFFFPCACSGYGTSIIINIIVGVSSVDYGIVQYLLSSAVSPMADGCMSCSVKTKIGTRIDYKLSKINLLVSHCAVHPRSSPSGVNCLALTSSA